MIGDLKNAHNSGASGQEEQVQRTHVRKEFGTDSIVLWRDAGEQDREKQGSARGEDGKQMSEPHEGLGT